MKSGNTVSAGHTCEREREGERMHVSIDIALYCCMCLD